MVYTAYYMQSPQLTQEPFLWDCDDSTLNYCRDQLDVKIITFDKTQNHKSGVYISNVIYNVAVIFY